MDMEKKRMRSGKIKEMMTFLVLTTTRCPDIHVLRRMFSVEQVRCMCPSPHYAPVAAISTVSGTKLPSMNSMLELLLEGRPLGQLFLEINRQLSRLLYLRHSKTRIATRTSLTTATKSTSNHRHPLDHL